MKKAIYFLLLLFSMKSRGQVLKFQSGVGFSINTGAGFKNIALAKDVMIGSEFILQEFLYIDVMAGISTLHYTTYNTEKGNLYTKQQFMCLAVLLKKYYPLSKKSSFFWEVGPAFNYDFYTRQEQYTDTSISNIVQKNLGYSSSLNGNVGFKTQMTRKVSFDVSFYSQTDFLTSYNRKKDKIKTNRQLLSFTLYFKLK